MVSVTTYWCDNRNERDSHAGQGGPDLRGEHPATVDDQLGFDVTAIGAHHRRRVPRLDLDGR